MCRHQVFYGMPWLSSGFLSTLQLIPDRFVPTKTVEALLILPLLDWRIYDEASKIPLIVKPSKMFNTAN